MPAPFLALDFEGSHIDTGRGCPVQLGIAIMDGLDVLDSAEWIIKVPTHYKTGKPIREVDAYSLRISGLTLDRIEAEGVDSSQSCALLAEFVQKHSAQSARIVCFNVAYDLAMYRNMLFNASDWHPFEKGKRVSYAEVLGPNWTCAFGMSRRALPDLDDHKLDTVAAHFGLSRSTELHGAMEDAILAGRVFAHLAGYVKQPMEAAA